MRKIVLILSMTVMMLNLFSYTIERGSFEKFLIGNEANLAYSNWVSHIAEGIARPGYNGYAPHDRQTAGFGDFKNPTTAQLNTWGTVIDYFLEGELDLAQSTINTAGFPYEVVLFRNTDTGGSLRVLRELVDMDYYDDNGTPDDPYDDEIGAFDWGWGLYVYNPDSTKPIIVSAPHPNDDYITPIIGYDSFLATDAAFFMVSGAGREVKWSNVPPYTNAKSISDPTRNANHPFNVAYKRFADKIREDFQTREFSLQVHAYDYDLHIGFAATQISSGNGKTCPTLPIRDLSSNKRDMINQGDHLMIPANTIGTHADVYLNDYYSVYYYIYDFIFSDGDVSYPVNDYIDLPGYQQSVQTIYTLDGWNDYDNISPFFHIEMDELPNCYTQDELNYKWFHGWDENIGKWDMPNRYERPRQYYKRWIDDLSAVLDDMFEMDDGLVPPVPENLIVRNTSMYSVTLKWDESDSYDFDSYEILYSTESFDENSDEDDYVIVDRDVYAVLAAQACTTLKVTGLARDTSYYFRIRARDKNNNYSALSNEVISMPVPVNIQSFTAHGLTNSVRVFWGVQNLTGFSGFGLMRKTGDGDYVLIDNYESDLGMSNGQYSYEYWDVDLENGTEYTYMLVMYSADGTEFFHYEPQGAVPAIIHSLEISCPAHNLNDSAEFGQNPYATDDKDSYWDINKSNPGSNYVYVAFWEQYWGNSGTSLQREVMGGYDVDNELKSWEVRTRTNKTNTPLFISVPTALRGEKIYLYDNSTGNWHDVANSAYEYTASSSSARSMTLYWGNLQPEVKFTNLNNQIVQGGDSFYIPWSINRRFLIDSMQLYAKNDTDSLFITGFLTSSGSNHNFIVPNDLNMPAAKIYMRAVSTDGQVNTFASEYTVAFVPHTSTFVKEPGWASISNPFVDEVWNTTNIFGIGAQSFAWDEEWIEVDQLAFAEGSIVNVMDDTMLSVAGGIKKTMEAAYLAPGWNLLGNPHLCEYELSNIYFTINGVSYRFGEMVAQELVSPAVYVYRDGVLIKADKILPYESFFIKNVANIENEIIVMFYPYYESLPIATPAPDWEVKVFANDDSFAFGASKWATDGYDFRYDLPKAPDHELFPNVRIYFDRSGDNLFTENILYSEYRKNSLGVGEEMQMDFPFKLLVKEAGEIVFSFEKFNIPDDWTAQMYFLGNQVTLRDGVPFTLNMPEPGLFSGVFTVYNHFVSNSDLVEKPVISLSAYPNPFNPDVNLAFSLPMAQECTVNIYNLRGQKVHTLHNGFLSAGSHTLTWDGKDKNGHSVASGMYFARVKTPKHSRSIKIMLLK